MKKRISILLIAVLLISLLAACGGGSASKNVPVADLADAVGTAIGKPDLADPGESYVKGYFKKDAAELGEYAIRINTMGTNIDEFGIFKAGTLTAAELKTLVESYLKLRQDSWMDEYMPDEKPKMMNAEVKVQGDYVMYCILSDAEKTTAFKAFTDALK